MSQPNQEDTSQVRWGRAGGTATVNKHGRAQMKEWGKLTAGVPRPKRQGVKRGPYKSYAGKPTRAVRAALEQCEKIAS